MKIFLDCSDPDLIKSAYDTGLVDGVTTNPTLMLKTGQNPVDVIYKISEIFSWTSSVSAEVVGETSEEMLDAAVEYYNLAPNVTIKLPCTIQGLLACQELSRMDIKTNVTLVFSPAQAILAAKAGATFISPFIGRLYDQYTDGIGLVKEIKQIYSMHNVETQILAASIRSPIDVPRAFTAGADVCTVPIDIFFKLYSYILTDKGLEMFNRDWADLQDQLYAE